jgi:tryptophan 7-halogenase
MAIPAGLRERIELYQGTGRIRVRAGDLFTDLSWFYIFEGLGVRPAACDPLLEVLDAEQLRGILASLAASTAALVASAQPHDSYFPPRSDPDRAAAAAQ